jgi:nicotinamidase-related amidase
LLADLQKEFVDPAMSSPAFLAGGEAILPTVAEAVQLARQRGILVVWVGL